MLVLSDIFFRTSTLRSVELAATSIATSLPVLGMVKHLPAIVTHTWWVVSWTIFILQ